MKLPSTVKKLAAFEIIRNLTKDWKDTEAYKQGIIDKNGNKLKKVSDLNTPEEKAAYGAFDRLYLNLKRILSKVPGGNFTKYAAALYLVMESKTEELNEKDILAFDDYISTYYQNTRDNVIIPAGVYTVSVIPYKFHDNGEVDTRDVEFQDIEFEFLEPLEPWMVEPELGPLYDFTDADGLSYMAYLSQFTKIDDRINIIESEGTTTTSVALPATTLNIKKKKVNERLTSLETESQELFDVVKEAFFSTNFQSYVGDCDGCRAVSEALNEVDEQDDVVFKHKPSGKMIFLRK